MKLQKTTLILILFYCLSISWTHAQNTYTSDGNEILNTPVIKKDLPKFNPDKFNFKMEIGTGFIGGSTSGMYTYLSPYLRYSVTPKFSLDVGGILSTGSSSLYPEQSGSSGSTSGLLFARGNYLLTERLTVSGSIYKIIYPNNYYSIDQNKRYSSQNYSYSLGMNYKVTKNLSFGAQVVVNKGINYNPLFQSQPSLFGGSSFDNTQSGIFGW